MRQQVVTLSEFLSHANYEPPTLKRKALLHGHCHQKAIFGMKNEQRILSRMGLDAELLDSGCCGLAGSFGFEEDHYDVSMKIGERVLLPRVRAAERDTVIITDGFSCREQIMHGTPRKALHLAEVLRMAMHQSRDRGKKKYIESEFVQEAQPYPAMTALTAAGLLAASGWLLSGLSRNDRSNGRTLTDQPNRDNSAIDAESAPEELANTKSTVDS